jgi:DNA primase
MNVSSANQYLDVLGQLNLDELNIQQAFDYYRARYQQSNSAQAFVANSVIIDDDIKQRDFIGYCDRTMGKHIPKTKTYEGAAIRGSLQRSGLVRASGHELFRGCVVFPMYHENGNVISAIGYRVGRIRFSDKAIVYWRKPEPNAFVDVGMSFAKELIREQAYH